MDNPGTKSADLAAKLRKEIRAKLEQNLTTPAPGGPRFGAPQTCPSCGGTGRGTFSATCGTCSGSGSIGTY